MNNCNVCEKQEIKAMPHEKRVAAGRLGGSISKRGKTNVNKN